MASSGVLTGLYNAVFRRNTFFLGTVFASAFALEIVWDNSSNKIWDAVNRGRQWKEIKHRYMEAADEDDE